MPTRISFIPDDICLLREMLQKVFWDKVKCCLLENSAWLQSSPVGKRRNFTAYCFASSFLGSTQCKEYHQDSQPVSLTSITEDAALDLKKTYTPSYTAYWSLSSQQIPVRSDTAFNHPLGCFKLASLHNSHSPWIFSIFTPELIVSFQAQLWYFIGFFKQELEHSQQC